MTCATCSAGTVYLSRAPELIPLSVGPCRSTLKVFK